MLVLIGVYLGALRPGLSGCAAAGPQEGDVRGIAGAAALRPTGYRWCMERSRCAAGSRHREEARC